jgi:hypothetical protein
VTAVDPTAVETYLVSEHADVLDAVRTCAAASAAAETGESRSDTSAVREGTEARLRSAGVWESLPRVLAGCVEQTGNRLRAPPVAAPPYVAATATGVVLRATLDDGRLVVSIEALAVERTDRGPMLRARDVSGEEVVRVEWRQ